MNNFFEQQDQAKRNTALLMGLFTLALLIITWVMYRGFGVVWNFIGIPTYADLENFTFIPPFRWRGFLITLLIVGGIILRATFDKLRELRGGGKVIAEQLGGELLTYDYRDPKVRQLLNVVEEMAIASGIAVPPVYILYQETGINAFAAGFTPQDAVIGVTRGCLEAFDRDQMQGVIGHEFSHILNGDMGLNLRLIGALHGLMFIYVTGRTFCGNHRSFSLSHRQGFFESEILGLLLIISGGLGVLLGRLLQSAVSRQREFLADASAVQFTRNPQGLAAALNIIRTHPGHARIRTPRAEAASHLFFGAAFQGFFASGWFATHPPLGERIRRLGGQAQGQDRPQRSRDAMAGVMGLQGGQAQPEKVITTIGQISPQALSSTTALLAGLPPQLRAAAREPEGAIALLYSLFLPEAPENPQWGHLQNTETPERLAQIQALQPDLAQLNPLTRLPLVDLIVPALRNLTPEQCRQLFNQIKALSQAGGTVTLSNYALYLVLLYRLRPYFGKPRSPSHQYSQLVQIWQPCLTVLSALARVSSPKTGAYALSNGLMRLPGASKLNPPKEPMAASLNAVSQSLKTLEQASPQLKRQIIDACAHTVLADGNVSRLEAELLRAVVIALDCPMPPFLEAATRHRD